MQSGGGATTIPRTPRVPRRSRRAESGRYRRRPFTRLAKALVIGGMVLIGRLQIIPAWTPQTTGERRGRWGLGRECRCWRRGLLWVGPARPCRGWGSERLERAVAGLDGAQRYPAPEMMRGLGRVVVFDQRWHGQGISSPRFLLEDCAGDVAALADALGVDTLVPAGNSMGSLVAQLVWYRHRERLDRLVLGAAAHPRRCARRRGP